MEKKLRIVLMSTLLISLVVVTYFIIFNSFVDLFGLNLRNTLAILSSILNLSGILIAASVAIYVMNKNHREAVNLEEYRIKLQEEIEEREVISALTHILYISHPLSGSFPTGVILSDKEKEFVKDQVEAIENNTRVLISKTRNRDDKKFKEVTDVSLAILGDSLVLKLHLVHGELSGETVYFYSKDIYLQALKYLENKESFPYKEVIENLKSL